MDFEIKNAIGIPVGFLVLLILAPISNLEGKETLPKQGICATSVTFRQFCKELTAFKLKPIVIYFWAGYSPPDRKWLKSVAELSERAKEHVHLITVAIDGSISSEDDLLKILRKADAKLRNYLLVVDTIEKIQEKWGLNATPGFLFLNERQELLAVFDSSQTVFTLRDIEKKISEYKK